jgi:hypothetical protein
MMIVDRIERGLIRKEVFSFQFSVERGQLKTENWKPPT